MMQSIKILQRELSRRSFLKGMAQAAGIGLFWDRFGSRMFAQGLPTTTDPTAVFSAIGNLVIPVDQDPGWKTFDPGITDYALNVMVKQVLLGGTDQSQLSFQGVLGTLIAFNEIPPFIGFGTVPFLQMPEGMQAQYFGGVLTGQFASTGANDVIFLASFVGLFTAKAVFFSNYPNHLATPDAEFQVRTPSAVKTGWDIMGFRGPVGPEEENRLRAQRGHIQVVRGMDPNNLYV
jgi:hypothetical protein